MRHRKRGRKLGRTKAHRRALMRNQATDLIRNGRIKSTEARCKELRTFVEPLITLGKTDSVHNRRMAARHLFDNEIVKKLFDEVGPAMADRDGGYTRVLKIGNRAGDGAPVSVIELVTYQPDLA